MAQGKLAVMHIKVRDAPINTPWGEFDVDLSEAQATTITRLLYAAALRRFPDAWMVSVCVGISVTCPITDIGIMEPCENMQEIPQRPPQNVKKSQ